MPYTSSRHSTPDRGTDPGVSDAYRDTMRAITLVGPRFPSTMAVDGRSTIDPSLGGDLYALGATLFVLSLLAAFNEATPITRALFGSVAPFSGAVLAAGVLLFVAGVLVRRSRNAVRYHARF